jgi:PAS domain S-box-containing protein
MVSLVETLPQNILRKDLAGRFTFVNEFFCRTIGKSKEEILGKTDFDLFPAELAAKFRLDDERVIANGRLFETEEENRSVDGQMVYVQVSKTPLYDAEQKPIGLQIVYWDVTARKKAQADLAYERDLLKTLMDNSPEMIYFKDLQSRFVRFSKSLATLLDLADAESLRGKTDFNFFDENHARAAFEDEQWIIKTGQAILGKVEKEAHTDGRVTWAMTSKLPWRDEAGRIIGTFGISENITSIKEAEAKLETVHQQLMVASRQAGMAEVATSVLHNVGNVLNSVNVAATLVDERVRRSRAADLHRLVKLLGDHTSDLGTFLTTHPRGQKVPEFLGQLAERLTAEQTLVLAELASLCKNVEHIKEIVAMQQNYAKNSGVIEKLVVTELVEDTLRMNAEIFARHSVRLVREYSPVPPINADKHKLLQILINLVRNAKYACDGSEPGDKPVTVRVSDASDRIRISIIDNGMGIPSENLTRIFNHGFTTRKDGHGFGLHSGALAAKELGGALTAHSDGLGKGATFILELPKNLAHL